VSLFGFAAHPLALGALVAEAASVVDGDGNVRAEALQQAELIGTKSVDFAMGSGEDSYQFAVALQRNGNFGAGVGLASEIVRVAGDVGSVVHFASLSDVADHSDAEFDAMAFAVDGTTAHSRQDEFGMLGIAEEQVDFDAAEGSGDFVHDAGNELFDVEGRGDAVSKFLQANEFGKPERRGLSGRRSGDADIGKGTCGHRETLQ
jgi:hypothetical protein